MAEPIVPVQMPSVLDNSIQKFLPDSSLKLATVNQATESKQRAVGIPTKSDTENLTAIDARIAELNGQMAGFEPEPLMSNRDARSGVGRVANAVGGVVDSAFEVAGGVLELPKVVNDFVSGGESENTGANEGPLDKALNKLAVGGDQIGDIAENLYNPINTEILSKEFGRDYENADGFFDGAMKMISTAASNPASAAEVFATSLPHMLALAKTGAKGAVLFASMVGTQVEEATAEFKKAHGGREPDAKESAIILGTSIAAIGIDKFQAKFILNQPILNKASDSKAIKSLVNLTNKVKGSKAGKVIDEVPYGKTLAKGTVAAPLEAGQETSQEALTILAAEQDLNALTRDDIKKQLFTAAGMGLGAGAVGGGGVQALTDTVNLDKTAPVKAAKIAADLAKTAAKTVTNANPEKAQENITEAVKENRHADVLNVVTETVDFSTLDEQGRYDNLTKAHQAISELTAEYNAAETDQAREEVLQVIEKYKPTVASLTEDHLRRVDEENNVKPKESLAKIVSPKAGEQVDIVAETEILLGSSQSSEFLTEAVTDELLASDIFKKNATPEQQAEIKALNEIHKSSSEVSSDIIGGSENGKFKGTKQHLETINTAIQSKDEAKSLAPIKKMEKLHSEKVEKLAYLKQAIVDATDASGKIKHTEFPKGEQKFGIEYIHQKTSPNFVRTLENDVAHLEGALGRANRLHNAAFDENSAPFVVDEPTVDTTTDTKPKVPAKEPTQAPVVDKKPAVTEQDDSNITNDYDGYNTGEDSAEGATTNLDDDVTPEVTQQDDVGTKVSTFIPHTDNTKTLQKHLEDQDMVDIAAGKRELKGDPEVAELYQLGVDTVSGFVEELRGMFGITDPIVLAAISNKRSTVTHGLAGQSQGFIALAPAAFAGIGKAIKEQELNTGRAYSLEVFYHEFGHIIEYALINNAPVEVQQALETEYQAWVKKSGSTSRQSLANQVTNKDGSFEEKYWQSKKEWLADQVARYIATKQIEGSLTFQNFIKDLAIKMKALYLEFSQTMGGIDNGHPVKPLKDFLDAHIDYIANGPKTVPKDTKPAVTVDNTPVTPTAEELTTRAIALAKERGVVSAVSLQRDTGVSEKEAFAVITKMKKDGVIDSNGKLIEATTPVVEDTVEETTEDVRSPADIATKESIAQAINDLEAMDEGLVSRLTDKVQKQRANLLRQLKLIQGKKQAVKSEAASANLNNGYDTIFAAYDAIEAITPPWEDNSAEDVQEEVTDTVTDTVVEPTEDVVVGNDSALGATLLSDTKLDGQRSSNSVMEPSGKKLTGLLNTVSNFFTQSYAVVQQLLANDDDTQLNVDAVQNIQAVADMFRKTILGGGDHVKPLLALLEKASIVPTTANPAQLRQKIADLKAQRKQEGIELYDGDVKRIAAMEEQIVTRSKEGWKPNRGDLEEDPIGYFIKEVDGKRTIDENLINTIAMVAFDWLGTEAGGTLMNDKKEINALLKRQPDHEVDYLEEVQFGTIGVNRTSVSHKLGSQIFPQLGIQIKKNKSDGHLDSQIKTALGDLAISVLLDNKVLVQNKENMSNWIEWYVDKSSYQGSEATRFIRLATSPNDIMDTSTNEAFTAVKATYSAAKSSLDKLLELPKSVRKPSFTPHAKREKMLIKRSRMQVPAKMVDTINHMENVKFGLKNNMVAFVDAFSNSGEDFSELRDMLGYVHDIDTTQHVTTHNSLRSKNLDIDRALEHYSDFVKENGDKKYDPIYFTYSVVNNQRIHDQSNTISLQNSKIHRHLFGAQAWNVTVDGKDSREMFALGVALAFGQKVDNQPKQESLDFVKVLLDGRTAEGKAFAPVLGAAKAIAAGQVLSSAQKDAIKNFVATTKGDKPHIMDGLMALASYDKKKPFQTNLAIETDGKTNGVVTGMLQSMLEEDVLENLAAGAIFTDGETTDFGEWISKDENQDAYQKLAKVWKALLDQNFKNSPVALAVSGMLSENLEQDSFIEEIAREFAKNPLMITNYGASVNKVVASFSHKVLARLYEKMSENRHNQQALDVIAAQMNTIMGNTGKDVINIQAGDKLLEVELKPSQVEDFIDAVTESYGAALTEAIELQFKEFTGFRDTLNESLNTIFMVFYRKYQEAIEDAYQKNGNYNLTNEQREDIAYDLQEWMPIFEGPLSEGIADGIMSMKQEQTTLYDKDVDIQQVYTREVGNTGSKSSAGHVKYLDFVEGGVGGMIKAIQSMDSATIQNVLGNHDMLNMFDAGYYSILDALGATEQINAAYWELNKNYSMMDVVQKRLDTVLAKISNDPQATRALTIEMNSKKSKENKVDNPIANLVNRMDTLNTRVTAGRKTVFNGKYPVWSGQYVFPGTSVQVETGSPLASEAANTEAFIEENTEAFVKEALGSTDDINVKDFANQPVEPSGPEHTVEIFDKLNKVGNVQETAEQSSYLRNLISNIVNKTLAPLELRRRQEGNETKGVINVADGYVYMQTAVKASMTFIGMSAQEVYTHELVHAITKAAIDSNLNLRNQLQEVYNAAQKEITWEMFLETDANGDPVYKTDQATEEAAAKARYNYIFNNADITSNERVHSVSKHVITDKHNAALHEFVAFGLTNKKVKAMLAGITIDPVRKLPHNSLLGWLEDVYHKLMDAVTGTVYLSKSVTADKALMDLVVRMTTIHDNKRSAIFDKYTNLNALNDKFLKAITEKIFKPLADYAERNKNSNNIPDRALTTAIGLVKHAKTKEFADLVNTVRRNIGITEKNIFVNLFREIAGRTKINVVYHHLLTASKHYVDQLRQKITEQVTAQVIREFKSEEEVTAAESTAILRALMETDADMLLDKYGMEGLIEILKDQTKLNSEIDAVKNELSKSNEGAYYIVQARGLGRLMAQGVTPVADQQQNAYKIATLNGTSHTPLEASSVVKQEQLIDELASLFALDFTNKLYKDTAVEVMQREHEADPSENGITFAMGMQSAFRKESLTELFKDNKNNMIKGYTQETFNPAVSVQIVAKLADKKADDAQRQALLEKNFVPMDTPLDKDANDPHHETQEIWVSRDSTLNTRVKGIFSLTNQNLRGTTLEDFYLNKGIKGAKVKAIIAKNAVQKKNAVEVEKQFKNPDMGRSGSANRLVPITDENGVTVDYRYLMSKDNKVRILEKDERFERVLGRMYGNKSDKIHSPKINYQTILTAHEDYTKNVATNAADFVEIGKHSKDPEMKELYNLLPEQAKIDMKKIWGRDKMYFRASEVRTAFGFRKWSIADLADIKQVDRLFDIVGGKSKFVHVAKTTEKVWQEFVGVAKDYIVVKLYSTVMNNMISNSVLLAIKGVPFSDIGKNQILAYRALDQYLAEEQKMNDLKRKLKVNTQLSQGAKDRLASKIAGMEAGLTANPVKGLLDEGVFQTISAEELDLGEDIYSPRSKLLDKAQPYIDKVPESLQTGYKWAYMTHGTPPYKLMMKLTQYSDFVARYTLYTHRMQGIKPSTPKFKTAHESALDEIKDAFINYDIPTGTGVQYGNDMGLLLFTKFPLRILKVFLQTFTEKPVSYAALYAAESVVGDISDVGDSANLLNILGKTSGPMDIFDSATTAAGLDLFLKPFEGLVPG